MNIVLPILLTLAAVGPARAEEPSLVATDAATLPVESTPWGTLQWVCNAKLMPGAEQTVGLATILPGKSNPIHFHPNCEEVVHVLSGEGMHRSDGQTVALRAGMTIRIPAGVKHQLVNNGKEPLKTLVSFSSGDRKTVFLEQTKAKTFIDYFLPMPIQGSLSKEAWGAAEVGAREPKNGLEDAAMKQWDYWDGQIIKAPDGKYHLFASRWEQAKGHRAWGSSKAVHAVSDALLGPYADKGLCWPDSQGGKGHNVTALVLPDGRYAVVISETRPGTVFVSKSLDGPWEQLGTIKGEKLRASNISIMVRPDGDYMIVPRSGQVFISKAADGILGPYQSMGPSVFPKGIPNLEDPAIFYSGGLYHIVVNSWSTRKAYHLTSKDGKTGWVNRGLAYDPTTDFCRYTDGTVNHWHKLERPGVLLENGHVVALTFAVLDTPKETQHGNDGHGSKIVVVPFDGAALDRDLQSAAEAPSASR